MATVMAKRARESDSPKTISRHSWQCAWSCCPSETTNEVACSPQHMTAWPHSTGAGPYLGSDEGDLFLLKKSRPRPSASHHLPRLFHTASQAEEITNFSLDIDVAITTQTVEFLLIIEQNSLPPLESPLEVILGSMKSHLLFLVLMNDFLSAMHPQSPYRLRIRYTVVNKIETLLKLANS